MENVKNCQPMRLLKKTKKSGRDNFFDILEEIRARYNEQPYWPKEKVYTPVNAVMYIGQKERMNFQSHQDAMTLYTITALAGWRLAKNIYTIAPELTDVLYEQADRHTLTMSAQTIQLPAWSVYIQPQSGEKLGPDTDVELDGFFVWWDWADNKLLLRFLGVGTNGSLGEPLLLSISSEELSIEDCIQQSISMLQNIRSGTNCAADMFINRQQQLSRWLSLILYLSAVNTDITQRKHRKQTKKIRDIPQEIAVANVGEEVAVHLRTLKQQQKIASRTNTSLGHTRKSPVMHLRRAHWHIYYTGSRSLPLEKRKQIVKWVMPTIVNQGVDAKDSITITNVL